MLQEQNPPERVDHPVVRTHPETGRKSLYAGPYLTKYILDMPADESDALLKTAFSACRPSRIFMDSYLAGRRSRDVGQSPHDASPRTLFLRRNAA